MPYLAPAMRHPLDAGAQPLTSGQLNYCITTLVRGYLQYIGPSYASYNEVIGVLECAKLELYARQIRAYEDEKIAENGDVWDPPAILERKIKPAPGFHCGE